MPFIPHTPESLIPRSDSKNPATTCKGITSSGRPCRRALAASPQSSPSANRLNRNGGVLAVLQADDDDHDGTAAFFCWQHKEQAERLTDDGGDRRKAGVVHLNERTSLDTIVDRLGILDIQANQRANPQHKDQRRQPKPARKETLPKGWQDVPGPLLAVSGTGPVSEKRPRKVSGGRRSRGKSNLVLSFSCCNQSADPSREFSPPPMKRQSDQRVESTTKTARLPTSVQLPKASVSKPPQSKKNHEPSPFRSEDPFLHSGPMKPTNPPSRPPFFPRDPSSQTQTLLSLIPKTLSPQTTSLLLSELAKPVSNHDDAGYIYMFWLTPSAGPVPSSEARSSLLVPPTRPSNHGRRTSEIVQKYAPNSNSNSNSDSRQGGSTSILLKIGRASNVQRRMNEWSRQCNHTLSLLRYYPYSPPPPSSSSLSSSSPPPPTSTSSSSSSSSSSSPLASPAISPPPQKVPNAHKIERLIHLELSHLRVKKNCAACGKEHREWFEVEGSRLGVGMVDEVVRRWVGWGLMR